MFCFLISSTISYTPSKFGYTGTDTVQAQEQDSIVILNEVPRSKIPKPISEKGYSIPPIEYNQYVWPDHGKTCTSEQLNNETWGIRRDFCKWSATYDENELYYQPVGTRQFYGNENLVNNSKRYKARFFINTRRGPFHPTGLYAPPGELITIEIPEKIVNGITLKINRHVDEAANDGNRLGGTKCDIVLSGTVSKFCWPYGGTIEFERGVDTANQGFDVNISGVIRCPYFIYGSTTDEEWEEDLSKQAGPVMFIDYGAGFVTMPSTDAKNSIRLNDAMAFWRGVSRVLYSVNEVTYRSRRSDGRVTTPMMTNLDKFVRAGEAVALVGANVIYEPPYWYPGWVNYESTRWGCWGQLHEYAHHFQYFWGWGDYGEVSNNVLNLISMSLMTEIDSKRQIYLNGCISLGDGWDYTSHPYGNINSKDLLFWYGLHLYWFGPDLQRKILYAHRSYQYFTRNDTYPYVTEYLLHISLLTKRDLRPYFRSFSNLYVWERDVKPIADEIIDGWGYKEFHLVSTIYQTGYVFDGVEFETAKPFRIPAREPYYFDFERYKRSREGMHNFTFKNVIPGKGKFERVGTAQYKYTPPDPSIIDKFYVEYEDDTNKDITTMVISVKQYFQGSTVRMQNYNASLSITEAYKKYNEEGAKFYTYFGSTMSVPAVGMKFFAVADGCYYPKKTSPYKFVAYHDEDCLLYISENPLSGDPDTDKDYLIANISGYESMYKNQKTKWVNLTKDKKYYMRFVVRNADGTGQGYLGYINNESDPITNLEYDRVFFTNANIDDVDKNPFMPKIENDQTLGIYYEGERRVKYPTKKFKLLEKLQTIDKNLDLNKVLFDGYSESQPTVVNQPLPIEYVVDFGDYLTFDRLWMPEKNRFINGNVTISCDGKQIYEGPFYSTTTFEETHHCRVVNLSIQSNKNGNYSGLVEFVPVLLKASTSNNIIPATHSKIRSYGDATLVRDGLYYNGKAWNLEPNSRIKFKLKLNETGDSIGIIGDKTIYGGEFEILLDDQHYGTCDTSYFLDNLANGLITDTYYQQVLYGIRGLKSNSEHTITLIGKSGKIRITGFLADGDFVQLPVDPTPTPLPTATPRETPAESPIPTPGQTAEPENDNGDNLEDGKGGKGKSLGIALGIVIPLVLIGVAVVGFFAFKYFKAKKLERESDEDALNV